MQHNSAKVMVEKTMVVYIRHDRVRAFGILVWKNLFCYLPGSRHAFSLGTLLENPHEAKHLHHDHNCQKDSLACDAVSVLVSVSGDANSLKKKKPGLKMNQISFNILKRYANFNYSMKEERQEKATFLYEKNIP